jgi:hypothetical protein
MRPLPASARARLRGEVRRAAGERRAARLEPPNGCRLGADGTIMAAKCLLEHPRAGG